MLAGIHNPFLHQVVADPWDRVDADVLSVNEKAFEKCKGLIEEVRKTGRSACLLMFGEAGSGKTHLMSRLRADTALREDAVFTAVRLETVATRIWRHLRRSIVTDLLRPGPEGRPNALLRITAGRDLLGATGALSYNLATVLEHYRADRYRAWCAAWLKGDPLPDNILLKMELAADESDDSSIEEQAHQTVIELCRLAEPAAVVIAFDQVEALQTFPGDYQGLAAYGKAATALHAELANVVLISVVQASFAAVLDKMESYVLDRLKQHRIELSLLTRGQSRQILLERMQSDPELAKLRAAQSSADPLWPLQEKQILDLFHEGQYVSARRLLHNAAQWFEAARGAAQAAARPLSEFLDEEYSARVEASIGSQTPQDADTILLAGLPVLLNVMGRSGQAAIEHKVIDFVVETAGAPIALCLVNQSNAGATARRLKKISDDWNAKEFARLRLLRDARLPFSTSGKVTQEALKALRARGAKLVRPPVETLAALEALRSLYASAQTGGLAHGGNAVSPKSVLEWFGRRVPGALQELVSDIMESGSEDAQFTSGLQEFLQKKCIVKLEDAADAVGATAEEVAAYARSHPARVGYLAGPPPVLFHPVTARTRPETTTD